MERCIAAFAKAGNGEATPAPRSPASYVGIQCQKRKGRRTCWTRSATAVNRGAILTSFGVKSASKIDHPYSDETVAAMIATLGMTREP